MQFSEFPKNPPQEDDRARQIPPDIQMSCWQCEYNQVRAYALWTLLSFPSLLLPCYLLQRMPSITHLMAQKQ